MKKKIEDYNFIEGELLLIDKPLEWTSFDVVKKIRNLLRIKKIGHAGTLDPLASGLLILAIGKFTKRIEEIQAQKKCYTGIIELGKSTPSFDLETEFDNQMSIDGITEDDIHNTAQDFIGDHVQTPPVFSAVKVQGKRAYEYARKGEELKLKSRTVKISRFDIEQINLPEVHFNIECSKGTYIRTIANDFGKSLDNIAYLKALRRESIGDYDVSDAWNLQELIATLKENEGILRTRQSQ